MAVTHPQPGIVPAPGPSALSAQERAAPSTDGNAVLHIVSRHHDLAGWATLPRKEQERVIGRTKTDSRELPERLRPPTAHISRVVIEEHGAELEIVMDHSRAVSGATVFAPSLQVVRALGRR